MSFFLGPERRVAIAETEALLNATDWFNAMAVIIF